MAQTVSLSASGKLIGPDGQEIDITIDDATFDDVTVDALTVTSIAADTALADGVDVAVGTTTGSKIGTATTQKIGFYNATPVAQPSAYTQTYSTADKTHADLTSATLTDNSAGTANTTVEALADGSTYANDVAAIRNNFADLTAQVNALRVDLVDAKGVINSLIDDLQALGLVG